MPAKKIFVSGRVQGVFFRGATARRAHALGVTGFARNLPDGRVEVLACGEQRALSDLLEFLHKGPPAARVDHLDVTDVDIAAPGDFQTG